MIVISVFITFSGPWGLLGIFLVLLSGLFSGGAPVIRGFKGRWGFLLFLVVIFLLSRLNGSRQSALLLTGRLALLLITAQLFTSSTSPGRMARGVKALLSPLPGRAGEKLAAHLRLYFTLLPMVFYEAEEISQAQRSRGLHLKRRPFRRTLLFTATFIVSVFSSAEVLSDALDSRGWRGFLTPENYDKRITSQAGKESRNLD
jgi:energy-coupling factor transporter transmembrane protein EcfT